MKTSTSSSSRKSTCNYSNNNTGISSNINLHDVTLYDLLANYHKSSDDNTKSADTVTSDTVATNNDTNLTDTTTESLDQLLIQDVKNKKPFNTSSNSHPGDIRSLLSSPKGPNNNTSSGNVHNITYKIRTHDT